MFRPSPVINQSRIEAPWNGLLVLVVLCWLDMD
jgi:hypothetical protein